MSAAVRSEPLVKPGVASPIASGAGAFLSKSSNRVLNPSIWAGLSGASEHGLFQRALRLARRIEKQDGRLSSRFLAVVILEETEDCVRRPDNSL